MDHHMTQPPPSPEPSWRKPAGMGLILAIIAIWAWFAVTVIGWLGEIPAALSLLLYAFAGIIWIAPLRPILLWMETGKWRE
jgi:hypothetical protein